MRKLFILAAFFGFSISAVYGQNFNWNWSDYESPNIAHLNFGYDFGVTAELGYSRLVKVVNPVLFTAKYSFPMGSNIADDFKFTYGGQVELMEWKNLILSFKLFGNIKRHETKLVRMVNLGVEPSILLGYYKPKWHIALESGVIKPSISNVLHSEIVVENYPEIQNGWYRQSGGYFTYGIQASKSIGQRLDLSLRIGKTNAFGKDKDAVLQNYAQVGLLIRF